MTNHWEDPRPDTRITMRMLLALCLAGAGCWWLIFELGKALL